VEKPSTETTAPMTMSVAVAVNPKGAKVVKAGTTDNLNANGAGMIHVDLTAPIALEVSAPGYKTSSVGLDGATDSMRVDLDVVRVKAAPPPPPKPKPQKKCRAGDENCDPFTVN
jgi:hypothetical protein